MIEWPREASLALEKLTSDDLQTRLGAVDRLAELTENLAEHVVKAMVKDQELKFPIWERLAKFGSVVVEPLRRAHVSPPDEETRVLLAAALLWFGQSEYIPEVLDVIRVDHPLLCVAIRVLVLRDVRDAVEPIIAALRSCEISDNLAFRCLVGGLRGFSEPLPAEIRQGIEKLQPEWLRKSFLY